MSPRRKHAPIQIEDIRSAIEANRLYVTDHADEEARHETLDTPEIFHAVGTGEIIEEDVKGRPYSPCIVYGTVRSGEVIHSVWAYSDKSRWAVLLTVYRPDPEHWVDAKTRRPG